MRLMREGIVVTTFEADDTDPKCDKCGAPITTGLMAAFCPGGKECEFWTPELDEFLAMLTPVEAA